MANGTLSSSSYDWDAGSVRPLVCLKSGVNLELISEGVAPTVTTSHLNVTITDNQQAESGKTIVKREYVIRKVDGSYDGTWTNLSTNPVTVEVPTYGDYYVKTRITYDDGDVIESKETFFYIYDSMM